MGFHQSPFSEQQPMKMQYLMDTAVLESSFKRICLYFTLLAI
jgi:hypothetical protein